MGIAEIELIAKKVAMETGVDHVVLRHAPKHGAGGYSIQPVDAPVPESCTVHSTMIAEFDLLDVAGGPAIRKPR